MGGLPAGYVEIVRMEKGTQETFFYIRLLSGESLFSSKVLARMLSSHFPVPDWPFLCISHLLPLTLASSKEIRELVGRGCNSRWIWELKVCVMERVAVAFTLILASEKVEKDSVFLWTSIHMPHWFAIFFVPRVKWEAWIAIQPLNHESLVSIN